CDVGSPYGPPPLTIVLTRCPPLPRGCPPLPRGCPPLPRGCPPLPRECPHPRMSSPPNVLTPYPPLPSGEGGRCTDAVPPLLKGEGARGRGPQRSRGQRARPEQEGGPGGED